MGGTDQRRRRNPAPNNSSTLGGDLSVAQDYENYLNNREAINALIAANPDSAFAAGWIATFARVNDLELNQYGASDFLGGLVGFLDSVAKAGLGFDASDVSFNARRQQRPGRDQGGERHRDPRRAVGVRGPDQYQQRRQRHHDPVRVRRRFCRQRLPSGAVRAERRRRQYLVVRQRQRGQQFRRHRKHQRHPGRRRGERWDLQRQRLGFPRRRSPATTRSTAAAATISCMAATATTRCSAARGTINWPAAAATTLCRAAQAMTAISSTAATARIRCRQFPLHASGFPPIRCMPPRSISCSTPR